MNKVTVTGNIVSRNGVTLFFIDGTSQVLPSDGFKTQAILDKVLPSLAKSTPVEIDLDDYSIAKVIEVASRGAIVVDKSNVTSAPMRSITWPIRRSRRASSAAKRTISTYSFLRRRWPKKCSSIVSTN